MAVKILNADIRIGAILGKTANCLPIPQFHRDELKASCGVRARFQQRFTDLIHGHAGADVGEIGTHGLPSAVHDMTRVASAFPEEELLSCRRIADCDRFSGWCVQRAK